MNFFQHVIYFLRVEQYLQRMMQLHAANMKKISFFYEEKRDNDILFTLVSDAFEKLGQTNEMKMFYVHRLRNTTLYPLAYLMFRTPDKAIVLSYQKFLKNYSEWIHTEKDFCNRRRNRTTCAGPPSKVPKLEFN